MTSATTERSDPREQPRKPSSSGDGVRTIRSRFRDLSGGSLLASWGISIGVHALLLAIMFKLAWYGAVGDPKEDLPMALTELLGEADRGRLSFSTAPTPDLSPVTESLPIEPRHSAELSGTGVVERMTGSGSGDLDVIGIGTGGADFSGATGGGQGPSFFGVGNEKARGATRIVYVVDRSGSMIDTFDLVREELVRSVSRLSMTQKFHVLFFNAGEPLENPPRKLVSAREVTKKELFEFIRTVRPEGSTNPTRAMEKAFLHDPEIIFFLTDGAFHKTLLDHLRAWNRDRRVKIFTIAYVDPEGSELLEQIAREHGGEFRYVSGREAP